MREDKKMKWLPLSIILVLTGSVLAKVDLVTLPERESVQLTIYNSADLTLARESRSLVLKEGHSQLQFSWENTLIDPTSLDMVPLDHAGQIDISSLVFPPRVRNLGLWNVSSEISTKVPVEISYLTSGLSWRAFYMGTLTPDEQAMQLQGYVAVTNNSGEDYENAQVRLIVGEVHLIDQIAELARRGEPYGRAESTIVLTDGVVSWRPRRLEDRPIPTGLFYDFEDEILYQHEDISKKGLSEYFLYTIDGTETIPNGWSKRLKSFDQIDVPVINLYKYEEQRYGSSVIRFLSFANNTDHKLGDTPIPGGQLKVYRDTGDSHLSYTGESAFKYIPVNEDVELDLGHAVDVKVKPVLMNEARENFKFDRDRDPDGYDEVQTYTVTMTNTRDIPVEIEITRNFDTQYWTLTHEGFSGMYEKEDLDTVKFTTTLNPQSEMAFDYTVRLYRGTREQDWEE